MLNKIVFIHSIGAGIILGCWSTNDNVKYRVIILQIFKNKGILRIKREQVRGNLAFRGGVALLIGNHLGNHGGNRQMLKYIRGERGGGID